MNLAPDPSKFRRSWNILSQHIYKACRSLLILLLLLIFLIATPTLQAISDTNQNGVSDLWERKYYSGQLNPTFTPTADSDGDGWTDSQEALAGTDPSSGNPLTGHVRPKLTHTRAVFSPATPPTLLTPEAITLTWPTLPGKKYTLFFSPNLTAPSWTQIGQPRIGVGTEIGTGIPLTQPDGTTPAAGFWRVTIADIDTDNDTLTNAEEHQLGTSPTSRDTDGDGVSDPDEILVNFTNPLTATDADGDGIPNDWEKWWASQILASGITLSESARAQLLAGNIAPGDAPFGDGTTNAEQFEVSKKSTSGSDPNSTYQFQMKERAVWGHLLASEDQGYNQCGVRGLANADVRWKGYPWVSTCPPPGWLTPGALQVQEELKLRAPYSSLSWKTIDVVYLPISTALFMSSKPDQDTTYTQFKLIENSFKLVYPATSPHSRTVALMKVSETYGFPIAGTLVQKCEIVQFTVPAYRTTSQEIEVKSTLTAGSQTTIDLLPVDLMDIKDSAKTDDDVTITSWDKATQPNPTDANIAWIEPHKSDTDPAPRMPQLVLNIPGLPQNVTLDAKLLVVYERPYAGKQADDTVKIPEDGSFQSIANGRWEIFTQYTNIPFFGGDATLTYKVNGGAEQTIKFAIGGRNPDDVRCKTYTQGRPASPWYSYAIEKHESESYNPGFYNQFWERHGNSSPINNGVNYTFTKGDALIVRSPGETGVGGTGLAQVTGAGGNKTVSAPREIFWNWQKNVDAFLVIMAGKIQIAETFMNDPTLRNGPGSMPNGQRPQTTFHAGNNVAVPSTVQGLVSFGDALNNKRPEDAVAIKAYNGASSHWCSWRGPTVHEWQFNYGQNNYVQEVCNEIEEAQP